MARKINLPAWDRTIQCAFHRYVAAADFNNLHEAPTVDETFHRTVQNFYLDRKHSSGTNEQKPLFCLPPRIRLRIWSFVLDPESVYSSNNTPAVTLNKRYFNKDIYPDGHFQSFEDASANLRRHSSVCFAFYAELMVGFCLLRRFHVTVSPFLGPRISPLAVDFVHRHSTFMSRLIIEFDFTKLGYGPDPRARALQPGTVNMAGWNENFVQAQLRRGSFSTLRELTLLCRRFYGNRPALGGCAAPSHRRQGNTLGPAPYVGDEHQDVIKPLWQLRGLVDTVRVAGFSDPFTLTTIVCLFFPMPEDSGERDAKWERTFPCDAWPLMPGQKAWLDCGADGGIREVCGAPAEEEDSFESVASTGCSRATVRTADVSWPLVDIDEGEWEDETSSDS